MTILGSILDLLCSNGFLTLDIGVSIFKLVKVLNKLFIIKQFTLLRASLYECDSFSVASSLVIVAGYTILLNSKTGIF